MNGIIITVVTAGVIALGGVSVKWVWGKACTHNKHHKDLERYPDLFKQHAIEHQQIKEILSLLQTSNVDQIRAQLVTIHDKAMLDGKISTHWKETFYKLFESYKANGGNGFMDSLKQDIDDL